MSLNESLDELKDVDISEIGKFSSEIMFERFCNGKEIDFSFSQ